MPRHHGARPCINTGQLGAGICRDCAQQQLDLLLWIRNNLLTESQLSVVPPGHDDMLRNFLPGSMATTTFSQENNMPRRIICDFREVPLGALCYADNDSTVYIKTSTNRFDNAVVLTDENGDLYDDDLLEAVTIEEDQEVEYPPRPSILDAARPVLENKAREMFEQLGIIGSALVAMGSTMAGLEQLRAEPGAGAGAGEPGGGPAGEPVAESPSVTLGEVAYRSEAAPAPALTPTASWPFPIRNRE
jgi:hypothetical protein